ncbi:MAG TPA: sialidase family protein [Gaiellaceae bacterium]|nr:sialidase family protein [Gaiellaceae bacterium]
MRGVVVAAVLGAVLATTAGAANVRGTARAEVVRGTPRADFIDPRDGRDRVLAGGGGDRIKAFDGFVDDVRCGPGSDIVAADLRDRVAADCETVSRRLAVDPLRTGVFVHATHVEPDSFSFGRTIVAVYQVGRSPGTRGGAAAVNGWSTSRDGGRTWRSGLLPSLTVNSRPRGRWQRASDPVVGYDARHGVWLASSLVIGADDSGLTVNRSTNGVDWSAPVVTTQAAGDLAVDKQWLVCDNWPSSPHYGNCYHAYTDVARRSRISVQTSSDGGLTWTAPTGSPDDAGSENRANSPGVQPVVRPDGSLLVLYFNETRISVIRSTDGGASFSRRQFVAQASAAITPRFRSFSLPSADVGPTGTVYVAWMDCQFRAGCPDTGADLVLASSANGVDWRPPRRVATGAASNGTFYTLPGLAADPGRPGALALAYYRLRGAAIDAFFISSRDDGLRWTTPRRLTPESISRSWLPVTQYGPMLADYISTSYIDGRPIPIIVVAGRPRGRLLDESVFAALVR